MLKSLSCTYTITHIEHRRDNEIGLLALHLSKERIMPSPLRVNQTHRHLHHRPAKYARVMCEQVSQISNSFEPAGELAMKIQSEIIGYTRLLGELML